MIDNPPNVIEASLVQWPAYADAAIVSINLRTAQRQSEHETAMEMLADTGPGRRRRTRNHGEPSLKQPSSSPIPSHGTQPGNADNVFGRRETNGIEDLAQADQRQHRGTWLRGTASTAA